MDRAVAESSGETDDKKIIDLFAAAVGERGDLHRMHVSANWNHAWVGPSGVQAIERHNWLGVVVERF